MLELEMLTEDTETTSICELYWELDANLDFVHKVAKLADLAKVDELRLPSLVRESCNAYIPTWKCEDCGQPYLLSGRGDFTKHRRYLKDDPGEQFSYVCKSCKKQRREREVEQERRQAEAARAAKDALDNRMRQAILKAYDLSARQPVDVSKLALTDVIYLLSMMHGGAYEHLSKIMPVQMFDRPLSPDWDFSREIIKQLHRNGLIFVHPDSEPEAFEPDNIGTFYIYRVYYAPPISRSAPDDSKVLFTELAERLNGSWSETSCQEALELWRRVAISECKEYLLFVLDEHHFEFSPGDKTTQYLAYALEHFSTAQVFNTIWRAAKDAAAYYQREGISKRQAANAAIASIQRISERAVAEGWDIKPFGRNYKCPQSVVSEVLYNSALRLGDRAFEMVPNLEAVRGKKLQGAP